MSASQAIVGPYFDALSRPITNAGSLCGRLFAGRESRHVGRDPAYLVTVLGDRIGGFNMVFVSNLIMSLCYWILLGVDNTPGLLVIDVIFGFVAGTFVSLQAPLVASLVPDMRLGGTYIGQVMCESFCLAPLLLLRLRQCSRHLASCLPLQ